MSMGWCRRMPRSSGTSRSSNPPGAGRESAGSQQQGKQALMLAYVLRILVATIPVMLIVATLVFLMLRLTPTDPAAIIAGDNATSEQVADIRKRLGLDQPILTQFFIWGTRTLQGDFGESFFFKKQVAEL